MNDSPDGGLPASLPLDLRRGLTDAADTAFPLRWGILGAGGISTQWVEALAACPGATVTAVAARDRSRAERFAARFGIAAAYGDYAAMVAAPEVDIVYVGTVTSVHKEHTLLAIAAGKHVLCEKPLATGAAEAQRVSGGDRDRRQQGADYPAPPGAQPDTHVGVDGRRGPDPSLYATANAPLPVRVFEYPLPGTVSMQRPHPNQHGFLYQAEAVHRCLAAGLRECPQYGRQESLHAMDLLTSINSLLRERDE